MKVPSSSSISRRSRAVFLPRACCFSTARSDPAWATSATRRLRSASLPAVVERSGGQLDGALGHAAENSLASRGRITRRRGPVVRRCSRPARPGRTSSTTRPSARRTPGPRWCGPSRGAVVVADHQSEGRGRLARSWEAPPGTSVAVSATVPLPARGAGWLPLLAGLARGARRSRPRPAWPPSSSGRTTCCSPTTRTARSAACSARSSPASVPPSSSSAPGSTSTRPASSSPSTPRPPWPSRERTEVDRNRLVAAYLSAAGRLVCGADGSGPGRAPRRLPPAVHDRRAAGHGQPAGPRGRGGDRGGGRRRRSPGRRRCGRAARVGRRRRHARPIGGVIRGARVGMMAAWARRRPTRAGPNPP